MPKVSVNVRSLASGVVRGASTSPSGRSGIMNHAAMYTRNPIPVIAATSVANRTIVGSIRKNSAMPADTPPSLRSWRDL